MNKFKMSLIIGILIILFTLGGLPLIIKNDTISAISLVVGLGFLLPGMAYAEIKGEEEE